MEVAIIASCVSILVGLVTLLVPIFKLNTNITELKCSIDKFSEEISDLQKTSSKHYNQLNDHEVRISILEDEIKKGGK